MSFSELSIAIVVAGFAFMAVAAIIAPTRVTVQFGIPELTVAGRNEVRAIYGGFGLAIAGTLAAALVAPGLRPGVCLAAGAALAGMAGGRVLSALLDRQIGRFPLAYLVVEVVGASLLIYAA